MQAFGALWSVEGTEPARLVDALGWVDDTTNAVANCVANGFDKDICIEGIWRLVLERSGDLREGGPVHSALRQLHAACQSLQVARNRLAQLAEVDVNLGLQPGGTWLSEALKEIGGLGVFASSLSKLVCLAASFPGRHAGRISGR